MNDTSIIEIIDLHPHEMNLLRILRNLRYGDAKVIMRDGLPVRVERVTELFSTLDKK